VPVLVTCDWRRVAIPSPVDPSRNACMPVAHVAIGRLAVMAGRMKDVTKADEEVVGKKQEIQGKKE
jgi:hypothetical protein